MYANLKTIVLGSAAMEITPEPAASNASELIPMSKISGVYPVRFQGIPSPPESGYWNYRFDTITVIRISIVDGKHLDIELQEVTNQPTWSGGTLADQQQAVEDIRDWLNSGVTPAFDIDAQEYFDRRTVPLSMQDMVYYNQLIVSIKSKYSAARLRDICDVLYLFIGDRADATLNIVKNAHNATESNPLDLDYDPVTGYAPVAANGYLDTNYNPFSDAVTLGLNDATLGYYNQIPTNSGTRFCGATDGGNGLASIPFELGFTFVSINGALTAAAAPAGDGHMYYSLISSTLTFNREGTQLDSYSYTPTGFPNLNLYALCRNLNGTPDNSMNGRMTTLYLSRGNFDIDAELQTFATQKGFNI